MTATRRRDASEGLVQLMEKAMLARTQAEANLCFMQLVGFLRSTNPDLASEEVVQLARDNLGYWIGHTARLRATLEPLYQCEHPYLGTVAEHGMPDFETAMQVGMRMAAARHVSPMEAERVRLEIRAELKAAHDARRARGEVT